MPTSYSSLIRRSGTFSPTNLIISLARLLHSMSFKTWLPPTQIHLLPLLKTASALSSHTRDTPISQTLQPWTPGSLPEDNSTPSTQIDHSLLPLAWKLPPPSLTLLLFSHRHYSMLPLILPTMGSVLVFSVSLNTVSNTQKHGHVVWMADWRSEGMTH